MYISASVCHFFKFNLIYHYQQGTKRYPPCFVCRITLFSCISFFIPLILSKKYHREIAMPDEVMIKKILLLGLVFYTFTQGIQFIGLSFLTALTVCLLLNLTPLFVTAGSVMFLKEFPSRLQSSGILFIAGVLIYFIPSGAEFSSADGLIIITARCILKYIFFNNGQENQS